MFAALVFLTLGKRHGYADRGHRESGFVAFSGQILPQTQVVWAKAVGSAVAHLDIYLPAEHAHPAAAGSGVEL